MDLLPSKGILSKMGIQSSRGIQSKMGLQHSRGKQPKISLQPSKGILPRKAYYRMWTFNRKGHTIEYGFIDEWGILSNVGL